MFKAINNAEGRIFISYRRSDAQGYAGRLSDSLEDYFGNNRVFRDIEDIKGGAAFGEVIEKNIKSADAVIVLMGPDWLTVTGGKDNTRRLFAQGDWVAQEIASAIELGIPLFPVLIEQTPMPRQEELPEQLHPLLQYNALTISDRSWSSDVLRLAKILSFDIPSANERKVNLTKSIISFSIFIALTFTTCLFYFNFIDFTKQAQKNSDAFNEWKNGKAYGQVLIQEIATRTGEGTIVYKEKINPVNEDTVNAKTSVERLTSLISQDIKLQTNLEVKALESLQVKVLDRDETKLIEKLGGILSQKKINSLEAAEKDQVNKLLQKLNISVNKKTKSKVLNAHDVKVIESFNLLEHWASGVPYIGIVLSGLLILYIIPLIDKERQNYLFASVAIGTIGSFIVILAIKPLPDELEAMWGFIGSIVVATGMFVFMNLSGFKVK